MFSYAWKANKRSTGYRERLVGTYRLLNEASPTRRSQRAAAVCTEQHQKLMEVTKLAGAADEYDEGLQCTPELESSVVTTAVCAPDRF